MAENEKREIRENDIDLGSVKIADEVVAMIAVYAAREVEGVADMSVGSTSSFLKRTGVKMPASKGVKVEVENGIVKVDAAVIMDYGYNIPATSGKIQTRIKQAIENMTGLSVADVNIRIAGIRMPETEE